MFCSGSTVLLYAVKQGIDRSSLELELSMIEYDNEGSGDGGSFEKQGYESIVRYLLEHGADVNVADCR